MYSFTVPYGLEYLCEHDLCVLSPVAACRRTQMIASRLLGDAGIPTRLHEWSI